MAHRLSKTERLARRRMIYHLWVASEDRLPLDEVRAEVPDAWHTIEADIDCAEPKDKVTLYLDRSVARAFKAMGKGYQQRINRILDTWLQMKIAALMETEAALIKRRSEIIAAENAADRRPGWGEMIDDVE
jgi:uncharacterized protein (DUF4415 family)